MELVKVLGKGTYGSVELFSYKRNDGSTSFTAVKIMDSQDYDSIDREFRILSELKGCPSIVQLYGKSLVQGTDCNGNKVYKMSMEYASAGTLTNFIERNRTKLSNSVIKDFTRMILQGLVSIHSHGYVHCDLKPDNLLLFPIYEKETWNCSYELKISDFGLTTRAGDESHCWRIDEPWVGTAIYMSPESVRDGTTVEKTLDLWSLGCIVLEMFTGERTWLGFDLEGVKSLLLDEMAPEIPETVPCDARQFLEKCFARKPEDRGTASELLLHPFLIGDNEKMGSSAAGERTGMVLRLRKPPPISKDIPTKPLKLKVISQKPQQFKKVSNKPRTVKILPPRPPVSNFVPVQ
ncbi:PREDICTED: mitogen-activated protein kinase kinase kinase 1-like [Camelina sativa]|uniref:Mitogen-activated protein kinase kinase kinase 1-like n=1 Tax=Camelina sativa TaxID=90675 RepID=A0ABM0YXZ0_CAMSA|nr:PREDICTED: mitogen-activated protein kinase kinase kinase 1-like [Camelina sativa]